VSSVCLSVGQEHEPTETAEPIEVSFGLLTQVLPMEPCVGWEPPGFLQRKGNFGGHTRASPDLPTVDIFNFIH